LAFKLFGSSEWNLNLNGPFKFKFKHYSPKPLWARSQKLAQLMQPKGSPREHGLAQTPSPFPTKRTRPSPPATSRATLHLPFPGAADKRGPLVSFPFFLPQPPAPRSLRRASPLVPAPRQAPNHHAPFSLFPSATAPARSCHRPASHPVCPRSATREQNRRSSRAGHQAAPHRHDAATRPGPDVENPRPQPLPKP
jgi:hypothetical protein